MIRRASREGVSGRNESSRRRGGEPGKNDTPGERRRRRRSDAVAVAVAVAGGLDVGWSRASRGRRGRRRGRHPSWRRRRGGLKRSRARGGEQEELDLVAMAEQEAAERSRRGEERRGEGRRERGLAVVEERRRLIFGSSGAGLGWREPCCCCCWAPGPFSPLPPQPPPPPPCAAAAAAVFPLRLPPPSCHAAPPPPRDPRRRRRRRRCRWSWRGGRREDFGCRGMGFWCSGFCRVDFGN